MRIERRKAREVKIGKVKIGDDHPIAIQSMTNTDAHDFDATVRQVLELVAAGADIVRLAITDEEALGVIPMIKQRTDIPIVADIQYNYRLAIKAIESGIDKVRINPGNIGDERALREVTRVAYEYGIPIRVGVNSGSLPREIVERYGVTAEAMVETAEQAVRVMQDEGFTNIVVSLKSTDPFMTIEANRRFAKMNDYPIHVGVTEAGVDATGIVKSTFVLATLLSEGIGDTIRVSLSGAPVNEIPIARKILATLGLYQMPDVIACPTCARAEIDVEQLAREVEARVANIGKRLKIAVMGCPVNGIEEAKHADIGIAGGKSYAVIFKKGEIVRKVPPNRAIDALMEELEKLL